MHWLLLALLVAFAPPTAADRKAAIDKNNEAIVLESRHDSEGALRAANEAIALDPSYTPAYYARGKLQQKAGDLQAARKTFEEGLKVMPPGLPRRAGRMAYELAVTIEELGTGPEASRAERQRALKDAIATYEKSLAHDPKQYKALYRLGSAYNRLDDPGRADEQFRKCIELNPRYSPCYVDLGHMYIDYGHADVGLSVIDIGLQVNDKDHRMYLGAGRAFLYVGRPDDAIDMLEKAKAIDPDVPEIRYHLGMAHAERRERQEAIENLQDFLQRAGNDISENMKKSANNTIARMQDVI